jgi:amidohydrolase
LNLQQIAASRINTTDPAVVSVCSFQGGEQYNVIPDQAVLSGTVRTFSKEAREIAEKNIRSISESACQMAGAECEVIYQYGYPSVWNHPQEAQRAKRLAEMVAGNEKVVEVPLQMPMEDFAYYTIERPGTFFLVGGMNPAIQATYPHHHPKFDVDERSILQIGKMFISLVYDYLNNSSEQNENGSVVGTLESTI